MAAVVGPHGFAGAFSPSRSLTHESVAVAPQGPLVPHGGDNPVVQIPLSLECVEAVRW